MYGQNVLKLQILPEGGNTLSLNICIYKVIFCYGPAARELNMMWNPKRLLERRMKANFNFTSSHHLLYFSIKVFHVSLSLNRKYLSRLLLPHTHFFRVVSNHLPPVRAPGPLSPSRGLSSFSSIYCLSAYRVNSHAVALHLWHQVCLQHQFIKMDLLLSIK